MISSLLYLDASQKHDFGLLLCFCISLLQVTVSALYCFDAPMVLRYVSYHARNWIHPACFLAPISYLPTGVIALCHSAPFKSPPSRGICIGVSHCRELQSAIMLWSHVTWCGRDTRLSVRSGDRSTHKAGSGSDRCVMISSHCDHNH